MTWPPIASHDDAAAKHESLVDTGDCEQQWGSAYDDSDETDEEPER
jgi:predicted lipoprotein with Yx(FWY)xxD motif